MLINFLLQILEFRSSNSSFKRFKNTDKCLQSCSHHQRPTTDFTGCQSFSKRKKIVIALIDLFERHSFLWMIFSKIKKKTFLLIFSMFPFESMPFHRVLYPLTYFQTKCENIFPIRRNPETKIKFSISLWSEW